MFVTTRNITPNIIEAYLLYKYSQTKKWFCPFIEIISDSEIILCLTIFFKPINFHFQNNSVFFLFYN